MTVKKGGLSYKCPVPMSDKEREFKGTKFLINSCLEKDKTIRFYEVLAYELIEASLNQVTLNTLKNYLRNILISFFFLNS